MAHQMRKQSKTMSHSRNNYRKDQRFDLEEEEIKGQLKAIKEKQNRRRDKRINSALKSRDFQRLCEEEYDY